MEPLVTWYARLQTTAEDIHVYELADATTDAELEARSQRIDALRAQHGIPDDWVGGDYPPPALYDVSVIEGPLHPSLLAAAQLHPLNGVSA